MDNYDKSLHSHNGEKFVEDTKVLAEAIVQLIDAIGSAADNTMANFITTLDLNVNRLNVAYDKGQSRLYEAAIDVYNEEEIDYPIMVYQYRTRQKDIKEITGYIYSAGISFNDNGDLVSNFSPELHYTYQDGSKRMYDGQWHDVKEDK